MINYIIINGTNSNTINGLGINELPPISKPPLRVQTEEIDGRDGDISTNLGYGAYDKTISIGLFGTGYDINEVISFFNGEGTVVFSNEPNKYYKYKIINQIDYEALLKFKSATITFHCQPFKYPLTETPLEIEYEYIEQDGVESATMNNTNGGTSLKINLKGNTSQYTTTGKNLLNIDSTFTFTRVKSISCNIPAGTYHITLSKITRSTSEGKSLFRFDNNNITKYLSSNDIVVELPNNETQIYIYGWYDYSSSEGIIVTIDDLMISTSGGDYEPYTGGIPAPNPDYPQDIHVVSGDNEVVVCGKNLFDISTITENKTIDMANGNVNVSTNDRNTSDYIMVEENTKYTCNQIMKRFAFYDSSKTFISSNINGDTITTPNNAKYIRFSYDNSLSNIQLEKGQTSTTYEPYQSQTYPINLGVENLFDKKGDIYYSWTGVDVTYDSDNQEYTFNGTLLTPGNATLSKGDLGISEGEEITMSVIHTGGNVTIPSGTEGIYAYSIFSQDNTIYIRGRTDYPEFFEKYTFTGNMIAKSGGDSDYVYLQLWRVGTTFDNYKIKIQIEKGSKSNSFTPYGTTPIELCKIGDYQDYFYKDSDKWYLHKEIGKVVLNGTQSIYAINTSSTNTTRLTYKNAMGNLVGSASNILCSSLLQSNNWSNDVEGISYDSANGNIWFRINKTTIGTTQESANTYLSSNNMTIYAPITPTNTEITNNTLIGQLDNIQNAMSYEGQTNIGQVNNDKPFLLDLIAMEKGTDEVVINNIGNVYAKPTIALEGTGETDIYLNNTEILKVDLSEKNKITIDTNNMEAYDPTDNSLANRKVIGNYNSMTLPSGNTTMKITGALTKANITNYTRWL